MSASQDVRYGRKAHLSANDSGLWEAMQRFWGKSYAGDYLGLMVLVAGLLVMKLFGEPFHQMFRLNDPRIQHPHAEVERVSVFFLLIYAVIAPSIILLLWTLLYRPDPHKAHVTVLGLAISIITTCFVTDVLKDAIGRPRPDLIARCQPADATPSGTLVTVEVCEQKSLHRLHDGWRSFPSGHSSFSFAGLGWLALFLASQTHLLRPGASLTSVLLCLAPLLGAALIAISRLEDYRHDVFDVIAGSVLGIALAYLNWRRYYPSLRSRSCDEPYSPPSESGKQSPTRGFQRVRDEEEGAGGDVDDFDGGEDTERRSEGRGYL